MRDGVCQNEIRALTALQGGLSAFQKSETMTSRKNYGTGLANIHRENARSKGDQKDAGRLARRLFNGLSELTLN